MLKKEVNPQSANTKDGLNMFSPVYGAYTPVDTDDGENFGLIYLIYVYSAEPWNFFRNNRSNDLMRLLQQSESN